MHTPLALATHLLRACLVHGASVPRRHTTGSLNFPAPLFGLFAAVKRTRARSNSTHLHVHAHNLVHVHRPRLPSPCNSYRDACPPLLRRRPPPSSFRFRMRSSARMLPCPPSPYGSRRRPVAPGLCSGGSIDPNRHPCLSSTTRASTFHAWPQLHPLFQVRTMSAPSRRCVEREETACCSVCRVVDLRGKC